MYFTEGGWTFLNMSVFDKKCHDLVKGVMVHSIIRDIQAVMSLLSPKLILTCLVVVVTVVVAEVVVGGNVDVLGQDVSQPATRCPASPAACGGRGGGGRGGGGSGGGGGAVDGPAYPVIHADAPLPAGRSSPATSSILFFAVTSSLLIAVALTLTL